MLIKNINTARTRQLFGLSGIFYFLFLFLPATACYCQQNSTGKQGPIFQLVNRQVDSYLGNDFLLMNAKIQINKFQRAKGKPYFETSNEAPGTLVLGKREYNNIQLLYDIYDQKLFFIAENARNKGTILELNNQVITRFYLDGRIFINSRELPLFPQSGFYEEIFFGKHLTVYGRWSKIFLPGINGEYDGEFGVQNRKLLLDINGQKAEVSTKHSFLKMFARDRNELNSYIKRNKIRLSRSNNADLLKLFTYAETLLR